MTGRKTTRRELLGWAAGAAVGTLLGLPARGAPGPVRAGLVLPADHPAAASVLAGAEMGADEARRTAELLGTSFELAVARAADARAAADEARRLREAGAGAIAGGVSAECSAALAEAVADLLEIRSRSELSPGHVPAHLSVTPGYAAHARALAAGLARRGFATFAAPDTEPLRPFLGSAGLEEVAAPRAAVVVGGLEGARPGALAASVTGPPGPGAAVPAAWHPERKRYGAAQLNDRFAARTGRGMDEDAWYGWMAVKLMLEAELRGRPLSAARTDGHKGAPLAFDGPYLEQPLYVLLHPFQEGEPGELEVIDV